MSVCNGARYLARALESILTQEGVSFEFLVIDDGSTDGTSDILAAHAAGDQRFRIIRQENRGLTQSLIRGCREAKGKFVARQDADDISTPGRLVALRELMDSSDSVLMTSSWSRCIGPEDEILYEHQPPQDPEEATRQLLDRGVGPPGHGTVMFRRSAYEQVGGYRQEFYYAQDTDLWYRLVEQGSIAYAQAFLYAYRLSPAQISGAQCDIQRRFGELAWQCHLARQRGESETELLEQAGRLTDQVIRQRASGQPRRGHRRRIAESNYFIGCGLLDRGDPRAAKYFREAIRTWPLSWRAWLRLCLAQSGTISRGNGRSSSTFRKQRRDE